MEARTLDITYARIGVDQAWEQQGQVTIHGPRRLPSGDIDGGHGLTVHADPYNTDMPWVTRIVEEHLPTT